MEICIENKKSIRMAVDEITEDVFSLNINDDSISAQNSNNPTVQNVPMEGNVMLYLILDY